MRIAPIALAAYRFLTDARYRHLYWQRRIENIALRERWAHRSVATLPAASAPASAESEILARDGILRLESLLSAREIADIRAYLEAHRAYDPHHPRLGEFDAPHDAPPEARIAHYADTVVVAAPHVLRLANHPRILPVVTHILGAKPTISYMAIWWSMVHGQPAEREQLFHRDYDDFRFLKLFFYLDDVDAASGPHQYVRGSHRDARLLPRRRYSDDEVAQSYAADDRLEITGAAGTAFLENTFGLHRGLPPRSKPRLMLQILYCLRPDTGGPRRPLCAVAADRDGVQLDPYINRIYVTVR